MPEMPVRHPDIVRAWVVVLVDSIGLTYRQIAEKPFFCGIPAGTLCSFKKDGYMTKEMRKRWPSPRPPRIAIRKDDMNSAARSIIANIEPELVEILIDNLIIDSRRPE